MRYRDRPVSGMYRRQRPYPLPLPRPPAYAPAPALSDQRPRSTAI